MLYSKCSVYKKKVYPQHWEKINQTLGFIEHPEDQQHWPPYKECDTKNPIINIIFSLIQQKKIKDVDNLNWFIETGTCDSITAMHMSSIFQKIDTVEKYKPSDTRLPENFYRKVKDNFKNINFYQGDSVPFLKTVLTESPDERACFWLDAHNSIFEVPLLEEIEAIKDSSNRKDHIILIDDADDCGQGNFPTFIDIKNAINEITSEYTVERINHCRGIIAAYT